MSQSEQPKPVTTLSVSIKDDRNNTLVLGLVNAKAFKTGSTGFFTNGKTVIDGAEYTYQVQLVKIGSKGA